MNKLKIAAAVTLLASGGMMFAACGKEKPKDQYQGLVVIVKADESKAAYDDFATALTNVKSGETLELHKDVVLDKTTNFSSLSVNIDGLGKYSISASDTFTGSNLLNFGFKSNSASDLVFKIKNCKIDAKGKARAIYLDNSQLVLESSEITGGKITDSQGGGVVITGKSVLTMKSGKIAGNTVVKGTSELGYDEKASEDIWLGSEVNATIEGGEVGKIFKNANNSGKEENQGSLVQKGGKISEVYVEYDNTNAATFTHKGGTVGKVINRNTQGDGKETVIENPEAGKTYTGNDTEGKAIVE